MLRSRVLLFFAFLCTASAYAGFGPSSVAGSGAPQIRGDPQASVVFTRQDVNITVHDAFVVVDATFEFLNSREPKDFTLAFPGSGVPFGFGFQKRLAGFEAWVDGQPIAAPESSENSGRWHVFSARFERAPKVVRVRYGVLTDEVQDWRFPPGVVPKDGPDATFRYVLGVGASKKSLVREARVSIRTAGGVDLRRVAVRDGLMPPQDYAEESTALVHVKPFVPPYGKRHPDRIELIRRDFEASEQDHLQILFTPDWARRMGKAPSPEYENHLVAMNDRAMMKALFSGRKSSALPLGLRRGRVRDERGRPVADAYVGILSTKDSERGGAYPRQLSVHNAVLSDSDGVFYGRPEPGAAVLRAEHEEFLTLQRPYVDEAQLDVRMSAGFVLRGRAVRGDGLPARMMRLLCTGPPVSRRVTTDSDGRFTVRGLSGGQHRVSADEVDLRRPSYDAVAVNVPAEGEMLLRERSGGVAVRVDFGRHSMNRSSLVRGRPTPRTRAEIETALAHSIDTSVIAANMAIFEHVAPGEYTVLLEERMPDESKLLQTRQALLLPVAVGTEPIVLTVPPHAVFYPVDR